MIKNKTNLGGGGAAHLFTVGSLIGPLMNALFFIFIYLNFDVSSNPFLTSSAVCEEGEWRGVWCLDAPVPNSQSPDGGSK